MKKWMIYAITWIVVIAMVAGAYYALEIHSQPEEESEQAVREGSKVKVDYIGMLASEYGGGLVFDTSMYDVAIDNKTYSKTPTFQMREKSRYTPLQVHVGGQSDNGYIQVIEGFSEGLIGMHPGERKRIIIPPEKGYGYGDPNLVEVRQLTETVPVMEEYPEQKFVYDFGTHPKIGLVVENPHYHWRMRVENVFDGYALVINEPEIGKPYYNGAWNISVESIDYSANNGNGTITIRNLIGPDDAYHLKGEGLTAYGEKKTFVLTDVNETAGTYTIDYNDLTKGRTLIFTVRLISIDEY